MYAVIEIDQDYDDIASVKCVKVADTREACDEYIKQIMDKIEEQHRAHKKYVEEYVNNTNFDKGFSDIEFSKVYDTCFDNMKHNTFTYKDLKYTEEDKKKVLHDILISRKNYHPKTMEYLREQHTIPNDFFPPVIEIFGCFYVVELPQQTSYMEE